MIAKRKINALIAKIKDKNTRFRAVSELECIIGIGLEILGVSTDGSKGSLITLFAKSYNIKRDLVEKIFWSSENSTRAKAIALLEAVRDGKEIVFKRFYKRAPKHLKELQKELRKTN